MVRAYAHDGVVVALEALADGRVVDALDCTGHESSSFLIMAVSPLLLLHEQGVET